MGEPGSVLNPGGGTAWRTVNVAPGSDTVHGAALGLGRSLPSAEIDTITRQSGNRLRNDIAATGYFFARLFWTTVT
jgi:hypothetical protein